MRVFMPLLVAAAALSLTAPASANRAAAEACVAKLPANARLIYAASIGEVTPSVDLKDLVRSKTRSLVMNGKIARGDAVEAAQAAGACLLLAK